MLIAKYRELRWAIFGGIAAAVFLFVVAASIGWVQSFEALRLLEATLPAVRFFSSSVLGASVTILALMLTLLGLTYNTKYQFRSRHFDRIKHIATMATIAVVGSVGVLLFMGFPLQEAEGLVRYYNAVYYAIIATSSALGGILVSIVLMLNSTIRGLVNIVHPEGESDLIEQPAHERQPVGAS